MLMTDLESCYLAAQRDKMEFALYVPNHGTTSLTQHCSDVAG